VGVYAEVDDEALLDEGALVDYALVWPASAIERCFE
jgi:hypothetical protein